MLYNNQGQFMSAIYNGLITKEFISSLTDEELLNVCKPMGVRTYDLVRKFSFSFDNYYSTVQDFINLAKALQDAVNDGDLSLDEYISHSYNDSYPSSFSSGNKEVPYSRDQLEADLWIRVCNAKNKREQKLLRKIQQKAKDDTTIVVDGKKYKLVPQKSSLNPPSRSYE